MGFDLNAVKQAQEELNSRGGSKIFTRLDKDNLIKDIRVLEPSPSMGKIYWVEFKLWWVDGKPITSNEFLGEVDHVQTLLDEFEADFCKDDTDKDKSGELQWKKLRNATKGQGMKIVSSGTAFWLPILEFDWKLDKDDEIEGIYDDKGEYDPVKIKQFIKDGRAKILDCKVSQLRNINQQIITGRDGKNFLDKDRGYNLTITRAGKDTNTTYPATKQEQMPMPEEFYGTGALDVVDLVKASIYTNEYIEAILAKYFYGEALPEKPEHRFLELREKFKDGEEEAPKPTRSSRRAKVEEEKKEASAPTRGAAPAKEAEAAPTRPRRGQAAETTAPETGRGRGRSLVADIAKSGEVNDE